MNSLKNNSGGVSVISYRSRTVRLVLCVFLAVILVVSMACAKKEGDQPAAAPEKNKKTIVFADAGWDSIRFHNEVARLIIEKGYGYKTDVIPGSTPVTFTGLKKGDIDVYMEVWTQNIIDVYNEAIEKGEIVEVSTNFDDNRQGLYVPTFVIKGDPERGIKPLAPDLKSVNDLPKYWQIFKDAEEPKKGRIYGAIPGWKVDEILFEKYKNYGLDKTFNYFRPGSDTALASSIAQAMEKGKPWVGYYWEPTWIMGKYDMTLLEEPAYSEDKWNDGYKCAFPSVKVTVAVHKDLVQDAPEVVEFLKQYKTSSVLTSQALSYMQEKQVEADVAAKWFLKNNEDLWSKWVPADVLSKVKAALQ
jgi:glycine betaine/proline transport system substrate-binding protein